jgi:hypothetical protein
VTYSNGSVSTSWAVTNASIHVTHANNAPQCAQQTRLTHPSSLITSAAAVVCRTDSLRTAVDVLVAGVLALGVISSSSAAARLRRSSPLLRDIRVTSFATTGTVKGRDWVG